VEQCLFGASKLTLSDLHTEYLSVVQREFAEECIAETSIYVQMNDSFKRMAALTSKALQNREPVLLVGETGCGKTTLAELLAALSARPFFSINCHKHMEAADLLGSLRPSPHPSADLQFEFINGVVVDAMLQGGVLLIDEINTAEDSVLERLNQVLESGVLGLERGEGW
jgi:MoxR-like ATPase